MLRFNPRSKGPVSMLPGADFMGPRLMSTVNAESIISEFIVHYQPNLNLIKGRIKGNLQIYISYLP